MRQHADGAKAQAAPSRFPLSLFFILFGVLLLMAGLHMSLLVLMSALGCNEIIQSVVPLIYWAVTALGVTLYIRHRMKLTYEQPMQALALATAKVADGDFSIYIPPLHTEERYDYLDKMLLDFDKMVAELGSIETLKTDFFSNVSHEIKTPIALIQNTAQLMRMGGMTEQERLQAMDTIVQTSRKLSALINNLLKLNKLEKQTIQSKPEPYDLCEQLCECALGFEMALEKKDIRFSADIEDSATICADASLMELVWNNLLSNAIKFTAPGGQIILRQTSTENELVVELSDNGCGMSVETIAHIFDKFYQGDTSHATEGNGLGLSLALRILQLSNYAIEVQSRVGEGSRFTVTLPLKQGETTDE